MGGNGSGSGQDRKQTIESSLALDSDKTVFELFGQGTSLWDRCTWRDRGRHTTNKLLLEPGCDDDGSHWVTLTVLALNGESWLMEWTEDVALISTQTPLSGSRWWWNCPSCEVNRKALYCPPGSSEFKCRVCHRLSYDSSQQNHRSPMAIEFVPVARKIRKERLREGRLEKRRQKRFQRGLAGKSPRKRVTGLALLQRLVLCTNAEGGKSMTEACTRPRQARPIDRTVGSVLYEALLRSGNCHRNL
jgi:hypothetical protein